MKPGATETLQDAASSDEANWRSGAVHFQEHLSPALVRRYGWFYPLDFQEAFECAK
jgi:hypothetical protein